MPVYKLHIFPLCFRIGVVLSQHLPELLSGIWNFLRADLPVQIHVISNPSAIQKHKAPKAHGFSPPCPLTDADGTILLRIFPLKFQKKITGCLLASILSEEIIFHFSVIGAKRVKPARISVPIQNEWNKALGCNGFAGAVLSALSICKGKDFLIVQPEIYKPDSVHMPAVTHALPPPFPKIPADIRL